MIVNIFSNPLAQHIQSCLNISQHLFKPGWIAFDYVTENPWLWGGSGARLDGLWWTEPNRTATPSPIRYSAEQSTGSREPCSPDRCDVPPKLHCPAVYEWRVWYVSCMYTSHASSVGRVFVAPFIWANKHECLEQERINLISEANGNFDYVTLDC